MLLEVERRALNHIDKNDDVVVVPHLLKPGKGLDLDYHHFATLPPPEGIYSLQTVIHNGKLINIFTDLVFKYFCVQQVL